MWMEKDKEGILYPHEDALFINANVGNGGLSRILVDSRISMDIYFKSTLDEIDIIDVRLKYMNASLKGFNGGKLTPLGIVNLPITIGSRPFNLNFIVVDKINPY